MEPTKTLNFGQALEALKKGQCVSRLAWGKVSCLSLPKDGTEGTIWIKTSSSNHWIPNQTDVLQEDWRIVE